MKIELFKKVITMIINNSFYIQITDKANEKLRVWVQSLKLKILEEKLSDERIED
jgi:translation initiation factor IF-1